MGRRLELPDAFGLQTPASKRVLRQDEWAPQRHSQHELLWEGFGDAEGGMPSKTGVCGVSKLRKSTGESAHLGGGNRPCTRALETEKCTGASAVMALVAGRLQVTGVSISNTFLDRVIPSFTMLSGA